MSLIPFPKMLVSYSEGWQDVIRLHPSVARMLVTVVVPFSLVPPAMFLYSVFANPGGVFPELAPAMSMTEALIVAIGFFIAELLMVPLMANLIEQAGELVDVNPPHDEAFTLAAIAPIPLWLAPLALVFGEPWLVVGALVLAWVGCAALIHHGVPPLFALEPGRKARLMANFILAEGVMAWIGLMVVLAMILSIVLGFR